MSDGTHGHGTALAGSTAGTIGNIKTITVDGVTVEMLDYTTCDSSDKWREFLAGLKDAGNITATVNYDGSDSGVANAIHSALGVSQTWTVTFPDTSSYSVTGLLTNYSIGVDFEGVITQDINIKCTAEPTFTDVAA